MKKFFSILICALCFTVPSFASTNEVQDVESILTRLDALERILNSIELNQDFLIYTNYELIWSDVQRIQRDIKTMRETLLTDIIPNLEQLNMGNSSLLSELEEINMNVSSIYSTVYQYLSDISSSTGSILNEVQQFKYELLSQFSDLLDELENLGLSDDLMQYLNGYLTSYSQYLFDIQGAIESLDFSDLEVFVTVDWSNLQEIELDLHYSIDEATRDVIREIGRNITNIDSRLAYLHELLRNFRNDFISFTQAWLSHSSSQNAVYSDMLDWLDWMRNEYLPNLQRSHKYRNEWLTRYENETREFRSAITNNISSSNTYDFLTGEGGPPVDSSQSYLAELSLSVTNNLPDLKDPEEEIYQAQKDVELQMEDVTNELEDASTYLDSLMSGFLDKVKIQWGRFNPVLSFSFKPTIRDYEMVLSYDFSQSSLLPPCRAASSGIWAIVLFLESFFAISKTLHALMEN